MNEQEYIATRKQLLAAQQIFKAAKQQIVSDFLKEHYPDVAFTIEFIGDSLDMDIVVPAEIEQSRDMMQKLNEYIAVLNRQAEEED